MPQYLMRLYKAFTFLRPLKRALSCGCVVLTAGMARSGLAEIAPSTAPPPLPFDSVLAAPHLLPLYEKDPTTLSLRQHWRIRVHGLRMAPLHQAIWGIRKQHRTENRQLVPIRPFYFRASEHPDFRARSIQFRFQFRGVREQYMKRLPHHKDPILDIQFGGHIKPDIVGKRARVDTSYVARLTAFPQLSSGIFYRSQEKLLLLEQARQPLLETGRWYEVTLMLSPSRVNVNLDGVQLMSVTGVNLDRGLIALMTNWHPVRMSRLLVDGVLRTKGTQGAPISLSGLVSLPKYRAMKKEGEV